MQVFLPTVLCCVIGMCQPYQRVANSLSPGPEVNRKLYPTAAFSHRGKLIEGTLVLDRWIERGTPSIAGDIRWNGVESLYGGQIIMERWKTFQLCQLLEGRHGEMVRCIIVHRCRGADKALVVAGFNGCEIHQMATEWFGGSDDTEDVGAVTVYFELGLSPGCSTMADSPP